MLPTEKLRERNSESGSIGWSERCSWSTNSTSITVPTTPGTHTSGSLQP